MAHQLIQLVERLPVHPHGRQPRRLLVYHHQRILPPQFHPAHGTQRRCAAHHFERCVPSIGCGVRFSFRAQAHQHECQPDDDHAPRRIVAWRQLEFRPLGRSERAGAHRLQRMAQNQSMGKLLPLVAPCHWCFAHLSFHHDDADLVSIGKPRDMGCVGHTARHLDRMVHGQCHD